MAGFIGGSMTPRWMRNGFIYLLIVVAFVAIFFTMFTDGKGSEEIPITEVIRMAERGQIETIEVRADDLTILTTRGERYKAR